MDVGDPLDELGDSSSEVVLFSMKRNKKIKKGIYETGRSEKRNTFIIHWSFGKECKRAPMKLQLEAGREGISTSSDDGDGVAGEEGKRRGIDQ